jgi:deazaflavin-dependent oxidoreductase (nitroreductase family)
MTAFRPEGESMSQWNRQLIAQYRADGGRLSGEMEGAAILLLTTKGAKSGRPHIVPVTFLRDGKRLVVFASNAGGRKNPDWFNNLTACDTATVELGAETFQVRASFATGEERDRLYTEQCRSAPRFAVYQASTERKIPVVILTRI